MPARRFTRHSEQARRPGADQAAEVPTKDILAADIPVADTPAADIPPGEEWVFLEDEEESGQEVEEWEAAPWAGVLAVLPLSEKESQMRIWKYWRPIRRC